MPIDTEYIWTKYIHFAYNINNNTVVQLPDAFKHLYLILIGLWSVQLLNYQDAIDSALSSKDTQ